MHLVDALEVGGGEIVVAAGEHDLHPGVHLHAALKVYKVFEGAVERLMRATVVRS
ncbi:MAG TPA: hypothetical protein VNY74_08805 [Edaphobacter sp.]|nr:hypothetical protein [Edaphobacter sp.]